MESVTVAIAGKSYELKKLPYRRSKEWREKHGDLIEDTLAAVSDVVGLTQGVEDVKDLELASIADVIMQHADAVKGILLDAPDLALDALCDYSDAVAEDRERIEEEAYDDEITDAALKVVGLVYPLAPRLLKALGSPGQKDDETSKNSDSPSGDSSTETSESSSS